MTRFWTGLAALLLAGATMAAPAAAASDDTAAIKAVLATYKTALERRDLTGVDALFAEPGSSSTSASMYRTPSATLDDNDLMFFRSSKSMGWNPHCNP